LLAVASEDMLTIQVGSEMVSAAKANLEKANSAIQKWQKAGKQIASKRRNAMNELI